MKIFITGASGFIGGAVAKRLAQDHFLLAMARSPQSSAKVTALGARAVACSMETVDESHLKYVDVVIHCAAFVEPWGTWDEFYQGNVVGTKRLLEMAQKAGVKRFIHISTEAVLFHGQDMVDIQEDYPYPARSPFYYSQSKKEAEILVRDANQKGVFETIIIRPRMVWGPGDETIMKNLLEMVDKGRFMWIDGGRDLTSTAYIDNVAEGIVLALDRGVPGSVYFITDWEVHTIRDFITKLLATQNRSVSDKNLPGWMVRSVAWWMESFYKLFRIKRKPPITRFSAAIMSATCTIASDKAQRELGYQPIVTVEEGMQRLAAS